MSHFLSLSFSSSLSFSPLCSSLFLSISRHSHVLSRHFPFFRSITSLFQISPASLSLFLLPPPFPLLFIASPPYLSPLPPNLPLIFCLFVLRPLLFFHTLSPLSPSLTVSHFLPPYLSLLSCTPHMFPFPHSILIFPLLSINISPYFLISPSSLSLSHPLPPYLSLSLSLSRLVIFQTFHL